MLQALYRLLMPVRAIVSKSGGKEFWAVLDSRQGDALLALVKYKKGAAALIERLEAYERAISHLAAIHAMPHQSGTGKSPAVPAPL
jgi:hypothetical protein